MSEPDTFDTNLRAAFEPAYTLERELTGGGMSRVFLATERALNRRVVIKVLPPDLAAGVNRERFRREIQLAAQLQHPHIVPLYSAGEHGDLLYYTMPFIEGESLRHAIHERGTKARFSPKEVAGILHDVVDALAYAHERGVIHRDIKPGNVLRSGRHAVVTDFGVAKAISAAMPAVGMTTSGMAIGTPAYMAPEQLAGDPAADHRVDIYAVGLLAYELLTGEAPFSEPSPQETMAAQLTRDPQPIDRTRIDVPPALSALVMRCLAKSPEKRPQNAQELLAELDALALPSGNYPPTSLPKRRWRAAVVGVALLLAAVVWARQRNNTPTAAPAPRPDSAAAAAAKALPVPPPARPVLTRADSLAIAKAVEKKMAERAADVPAPVRSDSAAIARIANEMRSEIEKAVLDSLARIPARTQSLPPGTQVMIDRGGGRRFSGFTPTQIDSMIRSARGAASSAVSNSGVDMGDIRGRPKLDKAAFDARAADMGPPRRVAVWTHPIERRNQTIQDAGSAIMNVLRKVLSSQQRFVGIDRDSTLDVLAKSRDRDVVSRALNADMMATIRGNPMPGDSVLWVLTVWDLNAVNSYNTRSITSPKVSLSEPMVNVDSLTTKALRALQEMDRAPRKAVDMQRVTPPVAPSLPGAPPKKP
jgi:tRNA A-37 threonylcarbamoyl transferase component Bud32